MMTGNTGRCPLHRAFAKLTGVAACLALLPSGCSSPPKTVDATAPGASQSSSWLDPLTAPLRAKSAAKPDAKPDASVATSDAKPSVDLLVASAKLREKSND